MNINFKKLDKILEEIGGLTAQEQKQNIIIMKQYNRTDVTSHYQSGGETSGKNSYSQNVSTWKGRKEGFFSGLGLALLVEIIMRIIF